MNLYGIFDRAANLYMEAILCFPADAAARRVFREQLVNPQSQLYKYPTDYELVRFGSFDTVTGLIVPELVLIERGEKPENG